MNEELVSSVEDVKRVIPKKEKPLMFNGADLLALGIIEQPTLVTPLIPKVGIVALAGMSDLGKSRLLLQLCMDIALNDEFLGFKIDAKHKSVIYVSTEDDKYTISNRLQIYKEAEKDKIEKVRFLFSTEDLIDTLDKELIKQKADAIVLDTFADLYSGEMNQVNKVRAFMQEFQELALKHECVFIINHHTGKRTEEKPPSKNNLIGSQGFEGKARLVMELRQDYKDASKKHLCIVKGNYLKDLYKRSSYELEYDEATGFKMTGRRIPFDQLVKLTSTTSSEKRAVEKTLAIALKKEGKSNSEILKLLKEQGHTIAKSTLSDWLKDVKCEKDGKDEGGDNDKTDDGVV